MGGGESRGSPLSRLASNHMKIISNTIGFTGEIRIDDTLVPVEAQNHYELILKLLEYSDYFVIVSPYLFGGFSHFFKIYHQKP